MFVLTHTADVVRGNNDQHMIAVLLIILVALVVSTVLFVKAGKR